MSLSEDVRPGTVKCKIMTLTDPALQGKAWMREVMTQASIFGAESTIIRQWVAVEITDISEDDGESWFSDAGQEDRESESSIPATGLGILPPVKIEEIEEQEQDREGKDAMSGKTPHKTTSQQMGSARASPPASASTPRDEQAQRLRRQMRESIESRNEMEAMRKQLDELKAVMLQQRLPDGYITATRKHVITGTRGTREAWVAEAIIQAAANRVRKWKHPVTGKLETPAEYRRRMIVNTAIKESLKKYQEFYRNELEGDNFTIVRNVIMFGEPSSKYMKITLEQKLAKHVKTKEQTYQEFESKLREYWDELACVGRIISDEDKTLKLIAGMENDRRYKAVVKDVCNSDSNYRQCHAAFMQEAHVQNDLWREQRKNQHTHGDVNSADQTNGRGNRGRDRGRGRGRGRGQGRGGRGNGRGNKKSKQNACPFFLAHGKCRYGDKCRQAHFSMKDFTAKADGAKDANEASEAKSGSKKKEKNKRPCYQWRNEGACDRDDCGFTHYNEDGTISMTDTVGELQIGQRVQARDVPTKSVFKNMIGIVTGRKGDRFLIEPITKLSKRDTGYLMNTGLKASNLTEHMLHIGSAMSADRVTAYDYKAAFDPAADLTITPTEDCLVKGSVKTLRNPIRLGGFQKGSAVVEFRKAGLLCIRSNTGMPGYMVLRAYVSPLAKRTLISQTQLDEMGWYLELGGGGARVRRRGSQANFLVLARFEETCQGLPVLDVTEDMKFGEQDLRDKLGEQGGRKYPIPDELLVHRAEDISSIDALEVSRENPRDTTGDINLAQRYSQQEKLDLLHQILGHTNYMRIALMQHWDGDGPKPSSHVLAKPCAVCAIAKAHARPVRKESYEFKDDTVLGHVYADLSTEMGISIEGYKHYLSIFVQGASRFNAFYLRTRAEANQWIIVWLRRAHTMHYPKRTKFLHIDNELNTNKLKKECMQNGTQLLVNQRSAHEHNAKGERPIRTVNEVMRTTLLQGGAEHDPWWPIGVQNAIEVLNVLPPMRKLKQKPKKGEEVERPKTPNEIWFGTEYPNYKEQLRNLVTPFCEVTAIADDLAVRGGKTGNPGIPALYLGPVSSNEISKRAHLVVRYDTGKRFMTRHVIPNSDRFPLIHGPSPGLTMHPSIITMNKIDPPDIDLQPNFQEKEFDPELHRVTDWEGEDADREARHEAVNERLRLATGEKSDEAKIQVSEQDRQDEEPQPDAMIEIPELPELPDLEEIGAEAQNPATNQEERHDGSESFDQNLGTTQKNGQGEEITSEEKQAGEQPADENLHTEDQTGQDDMQDMPNLEAPILQEEIETAWQESKNSSTTTPFAQHASEHEMKEQRDLTAREGEDEKQDEPRPQNEDTEAEGPDAENETLIEDQGLSKVDESREAQDPNKTKTSRARKSSKRTLKKSKAKPAQKSRQNEKTPSRDRGHQRATRALTRKETGTYSRAFLARNPQQKFPKGTAVMSRWGPAIVQRVLANGTEAELSWPNYDNPDAIYTTKLQHFWLPEEKPNELYDLSGRKIADGDVHMMENTDDKTFRGFDIHNLVGKVKARDINLSLPRHRHQIQRHVLQPLCEDAEANELYGLLEKGTFGDPEPLPPNHRRIPVMWVYLAKSSDDGSGDFAKMKARLTVRGDLEKKDVDKADAYSPVSHPVTYKILIIAHMSDEDVQFHVFDVEQAFLSTQHKRVVYVGHPPGYKIVKGPFGLYYKKLKLGEMAPEDVLRLLLALYGGKECSRLFWEEFRQWHINYGFLTSHYEKCFLYLVKGEEFIKIAFHVDDGMVAQKGEKLWKEYLAAISKRFTMKFEDLEKRTKFLGNNFHLNRNRNYCLIEQSPSIDKMLQKFEMTDCNDDVRSPFSGELPTDKDLPATDEEIAESRKFDMRSAVGFLNWIEGGTKPELARPLKCAARYASNHGEKMRTLVKRMMRWCKRTRDYTMVLRGIKGDDLVMQIFTDASHATCPDTRRSISGVVIKLGGCTVLWKSLIQKIVSHSSTESELMALDKGSTIGMYVQWLVEVIGGKLIKPVQIFVDNQSAITMASNPVHPDRNLHVHARFFYIRDLVERGYFTICYLCTGDQIADLMCVFKSHESFGYLFALVVNVAMCVKTKQGDKIVYKWQMTPRERYIK